MGALGAQACGNPWGWGGRCAPSRGAAFTSSHCRTDLGWLTLGSFLSLPSITKQPSFSSAVSPRPEILTFSSAFSSGFQAQLMRENWA